MQLESDRVYSWAVQVWDHGGGLSAFSDEATFTSGLLSQEDWIASWIRGGPQMRKEFQVTVSPTNIIRATAFVSACQYYTLYLNGQKLGDQWLDSPWTNFYTNRSYTTIDIHPSLVKNGTNAVGLRIGQGFCASTPHDQFDPNAERSAILQLHLHSGTHDSSVQKIVTDSSWTVSDSPIRADSTYFGEIYDAREEQPGWSEPNFTPPAGKVWLPASTNFSVVAHLRSQGMQPIKVVRELPAISLNTINITNTVVQCNEALEDHQATVRCGDQHIEAIKFAAFGLPTGSCPSGFSRGTCSTTNNFTNFLEATCIGQSSCSVACIGAVPPAHPHGVCTVTLPDASTKTFVEGEPCGPVLKKVALIVQCSAPPARRTSQKWVFDFGQEFSGVVRLTLPPGTSAGINVTLKHAEVLAHEPLAEYDHIQADGSVYMGNLFWANPVDVYTTKGGSTAIRPETYTPSFTYHGFR